MHWGKVVIHCLMLIILFLLAAIFVNPLTDGIENGTMRVAVKELLRIGFTVGLLWLYARLFFKNRVDTFVFINCSRRIKYGSLLAWQCHLQ